MVNPPDEMDHGPDHVGVDLWRAFRAYEAAMFHRVAAEGFADIGLADSDILVHVGPDGTTMAAIARARGVSKQAVQGQVRGLARRGYLAIGPDPGDARARRVVHTARGRDLVGALAAAKRALHSEVGDALGPEGLERLRAALGAVVDAVGE